MPPAGPGPRPVPTARTAAHPTHPAPHPTPTVHPADRPTGHPTGPARQPGGRPGYGAAGAGVRPGVGVRPGAGARRDFRLLWAGQSVSLLGDESTRMALPLLAVTTLHTSAAQAALLPLALYLPFLLIGLPAGAVVDRVRRRATMIRCDALRCVCYGAVVAAAATDVLSFPLLLALVTVAGCATVFFQVAYTSYLPLLVSEPAALRRGNTRLTLSESLAQSLGPMLAGPVVRLAGPVAAVAGNAVSFAVSWLSLGAVRHHEPRPEPAPRARGAMRREVAEGVRFVLTHPLLGPVVLCGGVYVVFVSALRASLVLYLTDVLGQGPGTVGLVVGAAALGLPLGNLAGGRLADRLGEPRTLALAATVSVTGLAGIPAAGTLGSVAGTVAGMVVASVVHGCGEGAFTVTSLTLRQTVTPRALLGRMSAAFRFVIWGAVPLGSGLAAAVVSRYGLAAAVWCGGVGSALCLPVLLRRGVARAVFARRERQAETGGPG